LFLLFFSASHAVTYRMRSFSLREPEQGRISPLSFLAPRSAFSVSFFTEGHVLLHNSIPLECGTPLLYPFNRKSSLGRNLGLPWDHRRLCQFPTSPVALGLVETVSILWNYRRVCDEPGLWVEIHFPFSISSFPPSSFSCPPFCPTFFSFHPSSPLLAHPRKLASEFFLRFFYFLSLFLCISGVPQGLPPAPFALVFFSHIFFTFFCPLTFSRQI